MYLVELFHVITSGLAGVFNADYKALDGNTDFADLHVSIEYPYEKQDYPGIWVDFEPEGDLTRGGIDDIATFLPNNDGSLSELYLWRAEGWATYTIACMSSLQRARLHDELVRVFAFNQDPQVASFRQTIESNAWLAMNMNFDVIAERGSGANPGTPWGTEEIIYEITLAMQCVIEFVSDQSQSKLYPLAEIDLWFQQIGVPNWSELVMTSAGVKNAVGTPPSSGWE